MNCCRRSSSAFLTLNLLLSLVVARSSAAGEPVRLSPPVDKEMFDRLRELEWEERLPVLRALDPEEARWRIQHRPVSDRPMVRDRDAILTNPRTGRELVDRALAENTKGQPLVASTTMTSRLRRVFLHRFAAPNFIPPVARGQ